MKSGNSEDLMIPYTKMASKRSPQMFNSQQSINNVYVCTNVSHLQSLSPHETRTVLVLSQFGIKHKLQNSSMSLSHLWSLTSMKREHFEIIKRFDVVFDSKLSFFFKLQT